MASNKNTKAKKKAREARFDRINKKVVAKAASEKNGKL